MPTVANVWTVREILDYLAVYGATVRVVDGKPFLDMPSHPCNRWGRPVKRASIIGSVLSHLKARRAELLDHLQADPVVRAEQSEEEYKRRQVLKIGQERAAAAELLDRMKAGRAELVARVRERARAEGKPVWWMTTRPLAKHTGLTNLPDEARFICVQGDEQWTALPKIVPDEEPPPSAKPKRPAYQWTGG